MKIAALDFDGTVVSVDSTKLFFKYAWNNGWQFIYRYYLKNWYGYLFLIFLGNDSILRRSRHYSVSCELHLINENWIDILERYCNTELLTKLELYKVEKVIVISGGIFELIEPFCRHRGYTLHARSIDEIEYPPLINEEKVLILKENYVNDEIMLAAGNSKEDFLMLRCAKNSFIITGKKIQKFHV